MKIISASLFKIDHIGNAVPAIALAQDNVDLREYLNELLEKIADSDSKRKFVFESNTTEVKKQIDEIIKGVDFYKATETIAQRLLRKEQNAQQDYEHLKYDIQKGMLVHALIEHQGVKKMVISKAEHSDYLDDEQLKRRRGFPIKKKIYKAFLVEYTAQNQVKEIFVYDTNATISAYWWSDFLELAEVNTDEQNTDTAFDSIDKVLLGKMKKNYPADHNILRNRILGYFKSNQNFEMKKCVDNAVGNYDPVDSDFDVEDFKRKMKELPDKKGFDSKFTIKPEVIKAKKLRSIIPLNEKMDLHIKEYLPDMGEIIEAIKIKGQKYIRIRTETGFEAFKKNEN